MELGAFQHLISLLFVAAFKLATIFVGYLFAKLGYQLFLKGVTGQFRFHAEIKGWKADLISASPGLFFILMGAIVVGLAIYEGFSVDWSIERGDRGHPSAELSKGERPRIPREKSQLPPAPPLLVPQGSPEEKNHDR